jgi:hypothetical protein
VRRRGDVHGQDGFRAGRKQSIMNWFFALQYPHWMMIAGATLVAIGFVGFAFNQNRHSEPDEKPHGTKEK